MKISERLMPKCLGAEISVGSLCGDGYLMSPMNISTKTAKLYKNFKHFRSSSKKFTAN